MTSRCVVLSDVTNCAVVQMEGRRFPGVVIQGDSLSILVTLAQECSSLARGDDELIGAIAELEKHLSNYQAEYERVMREHGRELPYYKKGR